MWNFMAVLLCRDSFSVSMPTPGERRVAPQGGHESTTNAPEQEPPSVLDAVRVAPRGYGHSQNLRGAAVHAVVAVASWMRPLGAGT